MSKGLEAWERVELYCENNSSLEHLLDDLEIIEKELKQAEKDKEMLDIFKNAITIERKMPPELETKESEKGSSYVFREVIKIHENRIEEMLKKSLRKWVLKNAFPKELKALEIIKKKPQATLWLFQHCDKKMEYKDMISLFKEDITKEQFELLKEVSL